MELAENYGVPGILGFRNGYQGLVNECEPATLTPALVARHLQARRHPPRHLPGGPDEAEIVATLARLGVSVCGLYPARGRAGQADGPAPRIYPWSAALANHDTGHLPG